MASLPSSFSSGIKASTAPIRSYTAVYNSQNAAYQVQTGSVIRIDIPALSTQYIDTTQSFLKLTLAISGANAALDFNASCLFRALRVYSAGQGVLLESIDQYGLLVNLLHTVASNPVDEIYSHSVLMGSNEAAVRQGITMLNNSSHQFVLPLLSGVLGTLAERNIVCAGGFVLELELNPTAIALVSATPVTATLTDVAYVGAMFDVGGPLMQAMLSANGGSIVVPATSWRGFESQKDTSTSQSFNIGVRQSSVKTILAVLRRNDCGAAGLMTPSAASLSDTQAGGPLAQYQFRVGSEYLNPTPISSAPWFCAEVLRAFHSLGGSSMGSMINRTTYYRDAQYDPAHPEQKGSFCIGYDCESAARAKSHHVVSGLNTMGTNGVVLDLTYSAAPAVTSTVNIFTQYDVLLAYSNGQMTVSA